MQIRNIEGLTIEDLNREIDNGGRFIFYQYTISVLILTFKRSSDIYFVRTDEKSATKGLPYTLLSAVFGWWGIPWGPIYTIQTIINNIKGGKDVTQQVMASLKAGAPMQTVSAALAE